MATKETKTPMTSTQSELKAVAKTIGAGLRRQGHIVPHSHVLHAVAAALDKRDWHTLKAATAGQQPAAGKQAQRVTPSYGDRTLFLLRLAYIAGQKVRIDGQSDDQARADALKALERGTPGLRFAGVLKAGVWNVPADLLLKESKLDAGDFGIEKSGSGRFRFTVGKHELSLEVVYLRGEGWFPSSTGASALWAELARLVSEQQLFDRSPAPSQPVTATFWTDDRTFECTFDCSWYLAKASDEVLRGIISVGFSGDSLTDNIADEGAAFEACPASTELSEAFDFLAAVNKSRTRESIGYEVRVDAHEMLKWMSTYRPLALAHELCDRYGVSIVEAEEPELRGMWDWTSEQRACDRSFETADEAYLDATSTLGLLDEALRDF